MHPLAPSRTLRVLLVDDQQAYLDAARLLVEMTDGFEVVGTATTGEDGVAKALALAPDVVLMDVHLPDIDGLEATRRIVGARAGARVLVVSTYSGDDMLERALDAGAVGFVSKGDLGPDHLEALA